ncbi:MAG: MFS transporter [Sneathiella sp.]|nr:MFS transporter [Sneathiella sp.]
MGTALSACWPLLLGIGLMMLGNGLQGSLLGVRANLEGFSTAITGIVMSGYFVGFLFGSIITPKILATVGHVRVFAALASLASTATLLHAVFPDPFVWTLIRIVTGFCFAGLYIVSESWLNDTATNETRGQILSFYMMIVFGCMAAGQFLLTLADPGGYNLFIIISVLVSLALIPSALTASPAPNMDQPKRLSIVKLYKVSPTGVIAMIVVGMAQGAFFSMAAVYGGLIGLSLAQISAFISLVIVGGALLQLPIGRLSDKFDRRQIILLTAIFTALSAVAVFYLQDFEDKTWFMVGAAAFGGFCMPLYSLCIAYTNDYLEPDEMVAASSGLILVNGVGAVVGPVAISSLMAYYGASAFFVFLAAAHVFIAVFTLYRMSITDAVPLEDQGDFVAMPMRSGTIAATMNPETEEWEETVEEVVPILPFGLSKAQLSILADLTDGDDDDEENDLMDDGPSLWNRNG